MRPAGSVVSSSPDLRGTHAERAGSAARAPALIRCFRDRIQTLAAGTRSRITSEWSKPIRHGLNRMAPVAATKRTLRTTGRPARRHRPGSDIRRRSMNGPAMFCAEPTFSATGSFRSYGSVRKTMFPSSSKNTFQYSRHPRNRPGQVVEGLLARRARRVPGLGCAFLLRDQRREAERIRNPNAAMTEVPLGPLEQDPIGGVVQVDGLVMVHIELDQAQRVARTRPLYNVAFAADHVVASQMGSALAG